MTANLIRCFTEFSIGLFTFRLFVIPAVRARVGRPTTTIAAMCLSVASLCFRIDLAAALSFPILILALAAVDGPVVAAMSHPVLRWFGIISFWLYLLHQPFREIELELLLKLHPTPLGPVGALSAIVIGSASVLPFAWASYVCVEHPGRRLVSTLLQGGIKWRAVT